MDKDGVEKTIQVPIGTSMLEAAHQNDIELEGSLNLLLFLNIALLNIAHPFCLDDSTGACEGSLACSTCHVIIMVCMFINIFSGYNLSHKIITYFLN